MLVPDIKKISIDKVQDPILQTRELQLDILRLDKIHPVISGNKWFKLKYHFDNFNAGNYKGILTFGGAWSNHIVATACACYLQNIKSSGVIRGENPLQLSPTLKEAMNYKMDLKFLSREDYKRKDNQKSIELLQKEFSDYYIIPEGGAGPVGEKGAGEILKLLPANDYTHILCAVGTGTMFRGIKEAALPHQLVLGVVVLKGWNKNEMHDIFFDEYHFGGYAKHNLTLLEFMNKFYKQTSVPTDFVYTGKLAYAIYDLIGKDYFSPASSLLMIHSGGLQGNASLQKGSLIF